MALGLNNGDTIGITATSGPFDLEKFKKGIKIIESFGFKVKIPQTVYERRGYLAGSDRQRVETLEEMFKDNEVKAVFCARGGFGATRIIDKIDYELLSSFSKPLIGFSDVTALLISLNERSGIRTFHGPVITSIENLSSENISRIFKILQLDGGEEYSLQAYNPYIVKEGEAEGKLIGGNLCMLCHMTGTDFEPDFDGKILFLEDVNEPVYKIDRMLTQLFLSGKMNKLKGVVIGEFKACGDIKDIYSLFTEKFSDFDIPVLGGMGFGHGNMNELIPLGSKAVLSTYRNLLSIRL